MPKKPIDIDLGKGLQFVQGSADRRQTTPPDREPRVIWEAEVPGTPAHPKAARPLYVTNGHLEKRHDTDVERVLRRLWSMARDGQIDGITLVAHQRGGGRHLIVAGECYDNPLAADGALSRLREVLIYHPVHPLEDHDPE